MLCQLIFLFVDYTVISMSSSTLHYVFQAFIISEPIVCFLHFSTISDSEFPLVSNVHFNCFMSYVLFYTQTISLPTQTRALIYLPVFRLDMHFHSHWVISSVCIITGLGFVFWNRSTHYCLAVNCHLVDAVLCSCLFEFSMYSSFFDCYLSLLSMFIRHSEGSY